MSVTLNLATGHRMRKEDVVAALGYVPAHLDNEVADINDYFAGTTDAALAMRNAIASGKKLIHVPPGTYVCQTTAATYGSATNPSCFEIRGRSDVWIIGYGATFTVDNSISGPTPVTTLSITADSKNCGVLGVKFVGNYTGLSGGAENVAINLASVTGITIRDVKITGEFLAAIAGVYIFDSLIENVHSFKNAIGIDIAHIENLTVRGCRFEANPSNPVTGINQHYDVPTLGDNNVTTEAGATRTLTNSRANRLKVLDCTFIGFGNSIAMEAMSQATVAGNTIRGLVANSATPQAGVLLYTTAGQVSTDTLIDSNEITGCGNSGAGGGAGVFLGANVSRVELRNNRIYDNTGYGLDASDTSPTYLTSIGDDWLSRSGGSTQIAPFNPSLNGVVAAAFGFGALSTALSITPGLGAVFGQAWSSTAIGAVGYLPNNTNLSWRDSNGNPKPIIGVSPSNISFLRMAADSAQISLQNASGTDVAVFGGTGGARITGALSMWNSTIPNVQPARAATLSDVITILALYGLTA